MTATGPYLKEPEQLWRQYIIGAIASISLFSTGYMMGWTSPVNVILADPELTPLPEPMTTNQGALIGSSLTIGILIGPFLGGYLSSTIGRRWGLLSISIPLMSGWILIAIGTNIGLLYAARVLWGLGVGMLLAISPVYNIEIATVEARGALGTYIQTFTTFGNLIVYVVGAFTTYRGLAYVGMGFMVFFMVAFFFMPESPTFLLLKNDRKGAAKALMMLRGRSLEAVQEELDMISADVQTSNDNKPGSVADIFRGKNFKAFYIGCLLVFFQQFSGIIAVQMNMTDIFKAAGTNIEPAYATIVAGAVQFLASLTTQFMVNRLKRRTLLMISSCGASVALVLLGTYFLLAEKESPIIESINFLPLLTMVLFMLMYCWGLGALPSAILSEIVPIEVKSLFMAVVATFGGTLSFGVIWVYSVVSAAAGHYVVFWIFAANCVVCFFFTLFILPESKGKSVNEIQDMLAGRKTKHDNI